MSKRKGDRHPRGALSSLDRALLQHIHAWGIGAARPLATILGIPYSICTYHLRLLHRRHYLESLGYPLLNPSEREFLRYYRPVLTRRRISESFIVRPDNLPLVRPSKFRLRDGRYLPSHQIASLMTAEWVAFVMRHWGERPTIIPEFVLRYGQGWYGSGKAPRHPTPVLTMVPDFLVEIRETPIHFEVELTPKNASRYEQALLRIQPRNRPVIFIAETDELASTVRRRLPPKRPSMAVLPLGDDETLKVVLERILPVAG